jgi:hypothetical protein
MDTTTSQGIDADIVQAVDALTDALNHTRVVFAEHLTATTVRDFPHATEVHFGADHNAFFIEVRSPQGEQYVSDPTHPLAVLAGLYFAVLGDGVYRLDVATGTVTTLTR